MDFGVREGTLFSPAPEHQLTRIMMLFVSRERFHIEKILINQILALGS